MSIPIINMLPQFQPIGTGNPDVAPGSPELSIGPLQFAPGTTDTPVAGPNARTISNVVVYGGQSADGENANTDDPTGTKKRIVDVRRTLFGKNPEHFSKTGEISTADLGGDTFFSTPKKKGNFLFLVHSVSVQWNPVV